MWNQSAPGGAPSYYGHAPPPAGPPPSAKPPSASGQKHDIFVGNLAFSTTKEQLYTASSELGRIIKVRIVSDLETGKPRGFAFIEFEDPQAALSAIRNMNEYEINGRKIRVNFSNSSHSRERSSRGGGRGAGLPAPAEMQPPPSMPPPPAGIQPAQPAVAGLDPSLVQQVMALTPAQISQLPPDKQQSILALRQQIAGGVRR